MTSAAGSTSADRDARIGRLARCVNISRWFRYCASETEEHFLHFIRDDDISLLVRLGVTGVRLTIAIDQIARPPIDDRPDPQRLSYVRRAIDRLVAAGLAVVLVIHDVPRRIETDRAFSEGFVRFWGEFARGIQPWAAPELLFIEPMNEPVFESAQSHWYELEQRLIEAIRAALPHNTLVLSGTNWGGIDGLRRRKPSSDENAVYSFHFYDPYIFTHQGAPWVDFWVRALRRVPYPLTSEAVSDKVDPADPSFWDLRNHAGSRGGGRRLIANRIGSAAAWGAAHGVPVWMGEFGCYPRFAVRRDVLRWFADVRAAVEQHGVGWAIWSYDEELGLNRRIVQGHVAIDREIAAAVGLTPPGADRIV